MEMSQGWINETVAGYMDQPRALTKSKYFFWDYEAGFPLTCNGTAQYKIDSSIMLDCTP